MVNNSRSVSEMFQFLEEAKISYQNNCHVIVENAKNLAKLYDDLSTSYDILNRETNENLETIEKVLSSAKQFQDLSEVKNYLAPLKAYFDSSRYKSLDDKMRANHKQLNEVGQVGCILNL